MKAAPTPRLPRDGGPGPQGSEGLNQDFPKVAAGPSNPLQLIQHTFPEDQQRPRRWTSQLLEAERAKRPSPKSGQADGGSEDSLHLDIQKLKEKRDLLDTEISQLISEGYSVDELEDHISQLHEYNDIKDVGQMLLGKLAVIRGVTTKELYAEFGLDMND
ncbi:DNA repair protein SWI5 homolog [Panthera tigris]|uniref:DNA repair protein SWI5 homolog n=1 Tax=Panthera tigris TaxID=9694 RepID=UPI001C6F6410|nr:DNA repair protein SWI5 homolog [Panthera tigris]